METWTVGVRRGGWRSVGGTTLEAVLRRRLGTWDEGGFFKS